MLTGPMDRDFRPLWGLLGALLASSLVNVFFEIVFCYFSKLLGSILSSQNDPPTLENRAPASAAARFLKNRRFRSEGGLQSVLGLSWASFGRSWGSLGGLLGFSAVLAGGFSGAKEPSWAPLGCSCCPSSRLFSCDILRRRCFFTSWGLFGSILGLQDDPPTLKNRAPASAAARFLKNQRFRSEDGLESAV